MRPLGAVYSQGFWERCLATLAALEHLAISVHRNSNTASSLPVSRTMVLDSAADVQALLDAVAAVAEPIRLSHLWRPSLPDPQDDMVLETAVNGRADVLVSFNLRHFEPAAAELGLHVLRPGDAVGHLEKRA